jgi:Sulfotransferase family
MRSSERRLDVFQAHRPRTARAWFTLFAGKSRYQSTGRLRPVAGADGVPRLVLRGSIAFALVAFAVFYWFWPNDLVPDSQPWGRADDIAIGLINSVAAIRLVAVRRRRSPAAAGQATSPAAVAAARATEVEPAAAKRPSFAVQKPRGVRELDAIAERLAAYGPPIVVYNASHSGSRLLTRMLSSMGVYMGANLNASEDSIEMAELVEHVILEHAPDFSGLFADGDPLLGELALAGVAAHLAGRPPGAPWGWKLCETGHALPVISRLFPGAMVLHLIRDGRDVAFSTFVAPKHAYWRKIHFNTAEIRSWRGLAMTQRAYRANAPLFNSVRWANSVSLGRAHGAMLGDRYIEVRYERLVSEPAEVSRQLAAMLGLPAPDFAGAGVEVDESRVGKWRAEDPRALGEVCELIGPTLHAFGYLPED